MVHTLLTTNSIDFGKTWDDPARGYWVSSSQRKVDDDDDDDDNGEEGRGANGSGRRKRKRKGKPEMEEVWYKFETPHKLYEKFAVKMEFQVTPLCLLADIYPHESLHID